MPVFATAIAAAALTGVLVVATAAGVVMTAVAVGLVVLVLTMGVVGNVPLPSMRVVAWVALLGGVGCIGWTAWDGIPSLTPVSAMLGPALLVLIVVQLARRGERTMLTADIAFGVTGVALAFMPMFWLTTRMAPNGFTVVALGLLGVGVAALAEAIPVAPAARRIVALLAAAAAAAVVVLQVRAVAEAVPAVAGVVLAVFGAIMAAAAFAVGDRAVAEGVAGVRPQAEPERVPPPAQLGVEPPVAVSGAAAERSRPTRASGGPEQRQHESDGGTSTTETMDATGDATGDAREDTTGDTREDTTGDTAEDTTGDITTDSMGDSMGDTVGDTTGTSETAETAEPEMTASDGWFARAAQEPPAEPESATATSATAALIALRVTLPVTLAGPVVYLLARILVG